MKFNTISIKNISPQDFVGTYSGVDIEIKAGKTRHLPSDVAKHIGHQLATDIFRKQDRKNPKKVLGMPQLLNMILSPEVLTKEEERNLTTKEQIAQHEKEFAEYLDKKRDEEILKREEALS